MEALPSASWQLLGEPALCLFPSQLSFVLCGHGAQSHRVEISSITRLKKKNDCAKDPGVKAAVLEADRFLNAVPQTPLSERLGTICPEPFGAPFVGCLG